MSNLQSRISLVLLAVFTCAIVTMTIAANQAPKRRPVAEILPAGTVAFFAQDGSTAHQEAWENTAAYESLYETGMMEIVEKLFAFAAEQAGQQDNPQLRAAAQHIEEHGMSLAISLTPEGPPLPRVTLVLHDAAVMQQDLAEFASTQLRAFGLEFESREVQGRSVLSAVIPQTPGIELSFWAEGRHLVILAGIGATADAIAVAEGDLPNLASNPLWKKYQFEAGNSESTNVAWIDVNALRTKFGGISLPPPAHGTINDGLLALGLHNLNSLAWQHGYKGKAIWSQGHVEVEGERTGLLSITEEKPFTLNDLPPLPQNVNSFSGTRIDQAKLWSTLTTVARDVAQLGPPDAVVELDRLLNSMQQTMGLDPQTDLLEPLGDMICVFADDDQGFLGSGTGVAIKVDDAAKLRATIDKLIERATRSSRGDFAVRRTEKHGREIIMFQFVQQAQIGALMIDKDWLVISLMPQTLKAFALRVDGQLPAWKPTAEQAEALAAVPSEFNSISIGDPRVTWHALMKLAPPALVAAEIALKENRIIPRDTVFPITTADIPLAEMVVKPLFPNVSVTVLDGSTSHLTSRRSMPGVPLVGGVGEGGAAATVAVGVALLLPAVQAAREAAKRARSTNNLKQLALSLHNYHDVYQGFPPGSFPNEKLKPEDRFSWLSRVLPFVEQAALYDKIDFEEAWNDEANETAVATRIPTYQNPGYGVSGSNSAQAHYVGMAGVGADAPGLAVDHPRAGIFGDNRKTRIRDIIDGTSNTIMVTEASDKFGAWAQGGNATYRPLTKKPYINGPDGIGGPFRGGCNMALGDGSVRFMPANVDPAVLEAMSTMAGREVVPNF